MSLTSGARDSVPCDFRKMKRQLHAERNPRTVVETIWPGFVNPHHTRSILFLEPAVSPLLIEEIKQLIRSGPPFELVRINSPSFTPDISATNTKKTID